MVFTGTSSFQLATQRLEAHIGSSVASDIVIAGVTVGVQLENGSEWLMTSGSFRPRAEIVFEKFVPSF